MKRAMKRVEALQRPSTRNFARHATQRAAVMEMGPYFGQIDDDDDDNLNDSSETQTGQKRRISI